MTKYKSYNGWPASPDPKEIRVNRNWEPIPGVRFPQGIKSGDVEVVMTYLVIQLDARVEEIDLPGPDDEWGYYFRPNVNDPDPEDDDMSCHASATAIDYNAVRHPNKKKNTWTDAQRAGIHQICNIELEGCVKNLTNYDEMHFEIKGSAQKIKAVADKIRNLKGDMLMQTMYAIQNGKEKDFVYSVIGSSRTLLTGPEYEALRGIGIPLIKISALGFSVIARQTTLFS